MTFLPYRLKRVVFFSDEKSTLPEMMKNNVKIKGF